MPITNWWYCHGRHQCRLHHHHHLLHLCHAPIRPPPTSPPMSVHFSTGPFKWSVIFALKTAMISAINNVYTAISAQTITAGRVIKLWSLLGFVNEVHVAYSKKMFYRIIHLRDQTKLFCMSLWRWHPRKVDVPCRYFRQIAQWPLQAKLGTRSDEAMKRCSDEAMRWSIKRFIASLLLPELNPSSLHCFNFLPYLTFHRFIASRICLHCLNALTKKNINA